MRTKCVRTNIVRARVDVVPTKLGIILLFWVFTREEKEALNMSKKAELGKGGGVDQAKMQLLGLSKDKKQCMLKKAEV